MESTTGFERINRVLSGLPVDRTPMMLHAFMAAAAEAGITMKQYRESPELMAKCNLDFADKYGLDGVLLDVDTALLAGALGARVDFPDDEPARVSESAPGTLDDIIAGADPRKLQSDERVQRHLETIRLLKRQAGGRLFIRGNADQAAYSLAMLLYGMENFLMDLLDEDKCDALHALIARCYDVHLAFHKMIHAAGADMTSFGDSSCGPDLISRELYIKFAHSWHKKLNEELSRNGIKTLCHICGKLDVIMDDVAGVGFAAVEIDYKTNLAAARRAFSGKSVVFGPIDPSGVFYFGTPGLVAEKTKQTLDLFGGRGLVIGAGCALPRGVPEANLRSFVRAVRDYGRAE